MEKNLIILETLLSKTYIVIILVLIFSAHALIDTIVSRMMKEFNGKNIRIDISPWKYNRLIKSYGNNNTISKLLRFGLWVSIITYSLFILLLAIIVVDMSIYLS
jgi:hypothetical protein